MDSNLMKNIIGRLEQKLRKRLNVYSQKCLPKPVK